MALKKSPRGQIKPYTREGVTSAMKKTAKDTAVMQEAVKLLDRQQGVLPVDEEAATDVVGDVSDFATRVREAAVSSMSELKAARKKVTTYLQQNVK